MTHNIDKTAARRFGEPALLDLIAELRRKSPALTFCLRAQMPLEKVIDQLFVRYQVAVQAGDRKTQATLLSEIDRQLDILEQWDGDGYPNGAWLIATMRCSRAAIVKDYAAALAFARAAEMAAAADNENEKAIALHNQAGPLVCLGKLQEAIQLELAALRISPGNAGFWANLCEALYLSGKYVESAKILATVPDFGQDPAQASVWKLVLDEDPCFLQMGADSSTEPAYTACRNLRKKLGLT